MKNDISIWGEYPNVLGWQRDLSVSSHARGGVTEAEELSCWPAVEAEHPRPAVLLAVCCRVVMTGKAGTVTEVTWPSDKKDGEHG